MNRKSLSKWKQNVFRVTLSKKILLGFVIAIVAFQVFKPIFAILVILLQAVIIYALIDRYLIKPIQSLTLSVIESRPTAEGFEYHAPEIHTGDELELLSDALKRMAADMNRKD